MAAAEASGYCWENLDPSLNRGAPLATKYRGPRREARALDTFTKLMRAVGSLRTRLEPVLTRHGLTPSQFGVLEALYHLGPLDQRAVGAKLLVSKGNITVVASNLTRDGLVTRTGDPEDGRRKIITLTSAGRRLVRSAFADQTRAIVRALSILTPAEQETLARLCRTLGLQRRTRFAGDSRTPRS
jgi:MarR family 2-MHQ and catechol resistance regulon transcriptional repressor